MDGHAHHNPYVNCPYNMAHQVPKLRLQRHLMKCRKQHPSSGMKACPFNATHIMPEEELQWHFRFCDDKNLVEGQKYNLNCDHGELGNPSFHPVVPVGSWGESVEESDQHQNGPRQHNYAEFSSSRTNNQDCPNGALSVLGGGSNVNQNLNGFGRGHLHYLLAKMDSDLQ